MKFIVVLALFGLAFADPEAKPEADPYVYYNTYGHGVHPYTYGYGVQHPYAYPTFVKPAEVKVEKVAEEADEKKPVVTYAHPYAYAGAYPYNYGYHGYQYAPAAYHYTVPQYYANSAGVVHTVAKREAEADPESYYGYSGYYGYPSAYRSYAYGHHYPYAYSGYYGHGYNGYYYGK